MQLGSSPEPNLNPKLAALNAKGTNSRSQIRVRALGSKVIQDRKCGHYPQPQSFAIKKPKI